MYILALLFFSAAATQLQNGETNISVPRYDCHLITNPADCLDLQLAGVHECSYCSVTDSCHDLGSIDNSCTSECCASKSPLSSCTWSNIEDIKYPDGRCEHASTPSNSTPYVQTISKRLWLMSGAAYCSPGSLKSWNCSHCRNLNGVQKVTPITVQEFQVFVADDTVLGATVVSFRGTVSSQLSNFIADMNGIQITPFSDPSIKVHQGFYTTYQLLYPKLAQDLISRSAKSKPLIITGHSLGAAMSTLAAKDLSDKGYNIPYLYNYGSPRVGNFEFHNMIKEDIPNLWRVTHYHDVVPHLPQENLAFYHVHNEVYYKDNNTPKVCDSSGEDPTCSNQCAETFSCNSVSDHLDYFGVTIGSDMCA